MYDDLKFIVPDIKNSHELNLQMVLNCWVQLFEYEAPSFLVSDMTDIKDVPCKKSFSLTV